eukprot:TRINITY_DN6828_c0_g1_i2.p2 TRINITY_DN6828_c0_g1~~TRINITY_DN6828_c0_g1_i2.p2  ORF type:complete len:195 (-),score=53.19 TRINITY_DN6828_c0_g1_i2:76-660(-)
MPSLVDEEEHQNSKGQSSSNTQHNADDYDLTDEEDYDGFSDEFSDVDGEENEDDDDDDDDDEPPPLIDDNEDSEYMDNGVYHDTSEDSLYSEDSQDDDYWDSDDDEYQASYDGGDDEANDLDDDGSEDEDEEHQSERSTREHVSKQPTGKQYRSGFSFPGSKNKKVSQEDDPYQVEGKDYYEQDDSIGPGGHKL